LNGYLALSRLCNFAHPFFLSIQAERTDSFRGADERGHDSLDHRECSHKGAQICAPLFFADAEVCGVENNCYDDKGISESVWEGGKMDDTYSAEVYRQGAEFRSVRLSVHADGSLRLDAQDMGKFVEETWGDSDYEFWIDVPSSALPKLVFVLLREKYSARSGAVDEFREFCKKEGIEHEWDSWV
jgi:hypothetical protein